MSYIFDGKALRDVLREKMKLLIMGIVFCAVAVIAAEYLLASGNTGKPTLYSGYVGVAGTENTLAMNRAMHLGIRNYRLDILLNGSEEQLVANMSENGASFLGILDYDTLGVINSNGACIENCNWSIADWNASVENAVNAYPSVHKWEIWNEPLVTMFQDGLQNGSTKNYMMLLKAAYSIIKQHNESDTVICLGGSNMYSGGPQMDLQSYYWVQELWNMNASKYCDAISLHMYTGFAYLPSYIPSYGTSIADILNISLNLYENLTKKQIYITETGIPMNNATGIPLQYNLNDSLRKQAEFLNQSFSIFLSKPYVKGVYWFNLEGHEHAGYALDFGMLNASIFEPRPSFYAFNSFNK